MLDELRGERLKGTFGVMPVGHESESERGRWHMCFIRPPPL